MVQMVFVSSGVLANQTCMLSVLEANWRRLIDALPAIEHYTAI